jgi:hypothetical protein
MQLQELTITRVYKGTKETKYGVKPTVAIKTVEHGDKWLSTFKVAPVMDEWKDGDKVKLDVEVTDKFINFKLPDASSQANADLEARVKRLEKSVFGDTEPEVQVEDTGAVQGKGTDIDDFDF